ncbi:hypothetical protein TPHA_0J02200 [Tetrapisispora phaffii CBS 4417]|uniref:Uncharacterized protein n=1 Tax=Tetrapisispora phaffii (strain ATCC 24235 / CBS 4417 / NBRC 1672 / NRRL Y-8282 / UCD 70-5) TaxID=1071381 RepID=G8BYU8_TETPH|nr:hypothetical protein TPHA_0J02200 [Tetrapisispora phaffii CBS 4417]CCE65040.1 hypothetical protein TPHA_0J02200 [Tetrapisispora phaffii CBS 4417]
MGEFICCVPGTYIRQDDVAGRDDDDENDLNTTIFCKSAFESAGLDSLQVRGLRICEVLLSDGTDVRCKEDLSIDDLKIYRDDRESQREYMWYEILRILSSRAIYVEELQDKVKFTTATMSLNEGSTWHLALILESAGIVEKIAEIEFPKNSITKEVDLFQYSTLLSQNVCKANDRVNSMLGKMSELESTIAEAEAEKKLLDDILCKRDEATKSVVLTLLNEKKNKIRELVERLKAYGDDSIDVLDDSNFINSDINRSITELNSPGKRHRMQRTSNDNIKLLKKKKMKLEEPNTIIKAQEPDDFEDFEFFGISPKKPTQRSGLNLATTDTAMTALKSESDSELDKGTDTNSSVKLKQEIQLEEPVKAPDQDEFSSMFIKPEIETIDTLKANPQSVNDSSDAMTKSEGTTSRSGMSTPEEETA